MAVRIIVLETVQGPGAVVDIVGPHTQDLAVVLEQGSTGKVTGDHIDLGHAKDSLLIG